MRGTASGLTITRRWRPSRCRSRDIIVAGGVVRVFLGQTGDEDVHPGTRTVHHDGGLSDCSGLFWRRTFEVAGHDDRYHRVGVHGHQVRRGHDAWQGILNVLAFMF